ncbi:MAG: hypothetical protein NTV01_09005 [Bacteroidia bacterium]|nr:hypothetical protein [Bacteroidia bacterium]
MHSWNRCLVNIQDGVIRAYDPKRCGHSVRCLRNYINVVIPTVTTTAISAITRTSATGGENVTSDGGATVTARGVCWSTSPNPTIANNPTFNGSGTGIFTSSLTGLTINTTYYVRAYATNSAGTGYGQQVQFETSEGNTGTFTDSRDNMTYSWVKIGTQTWMSRNLAYLPAVSPSATGSETGINYYVYGYEGTNVSAARAIANYSTYGALYNWPAALTACPSGWHLPNDAEWTTLTDYLTNNGYGYGGSGSDIGKSMAAASGWTSSSTAGQVGNDQASNNSSGFTALPGGYRGHDGGFYYLGYYANFWSASERDASYAWCRSLYYSTDGVLQSLNYRRYGFSVRCLQN